ncbi:hypothetical protein DL769_008585 [Monosporascus sp. CRB-8-3]|nr:hypothetical protein DL769_008585 [Monosporascus sp. CRB-8-3]
MGFGEALPGSSRVSTSTGIVITGVAVSLLLVYFWRVWWRLRHIPGPFPGYLTNFLRVKWVTTKRAHLILQEMHEKYGEVVRIGPNTVSFSNPQAIPTIYTARTGFVKASFYNTLQAYRPNGGALPAVFNTTDENMHKLLKTPIAPLFTPANAPAYEGHVDKVLAVLEQKLDSKFLDNHEIFNLGEWLQFFAFDVMAKAIKEKKEKPSKCEDGADGKTSQGKDFLDRYLELQQNDPKLPHWAPTTWTFSNVITGSDSVGTVMRTTMFHLLLYPHTLQKLYQELVDAGVSSPYPKYSEVRNLPYLDACVQEAIRMHPPFALPFERVVPKGGVSILGRHIPEGTDLGGNPYVVNRHKGTFGGDAEFWRPERWLEKDEAHKRKLEQSVLTFGAGRRVCIGRHIGILEVKKIISFLVLTYDIHIVDPERFQVENSWFFFQKGLYATIRKRPEPTEHMDRKGA